MPFGAHWYDLIPLVILALLLFGPKRLPEMGASIGRTIKEFQKSMREVKEPAPTEAVPPATTQAAPELPSASATTAAPAEAPKE
ncbi:MAG: twin-arginine translocase TatA/TatE family subunit [Nitrososphaerota archaeon]